MKVYMSFWTDGIRFNNTTLNLWKLSLALAKKHYSTVELITNSDGYNIMKDLPFSNFHIELNNIPNYPTIWCLGKIYAYKYACSINEPFLHLDGDVLLWEKLPESLTNSNIFAQSYDYEIMSNNVYNAAKLYQDLNCNVPTEWFTNDNTKAFNMGIFGGSDIPLINGYCDFVINMINNPNYINLWLAQPGVLSSSEIGEFNSSTTKSCLVEQGNLAIYCKNNNIIPSLLFQDKSDPDKITYKKYSHLIVHKNEPNILNRIAQRVSQEPYDLEPRNVSIENWHTI